MDRSAKHHYLIIFASLALCIFLYADSYLFPQKHTVVKVQDLQKYYSGRRSQSVTYTMTVDNKEYDIPRNLYHGLNIDLDVEFQTSTLTGSLQKVVIENGEHVYAYETGYVRARLGQIVIPIVILGCLAMLAFFKIIDNLQGRANLTYALFISSLLLLFSHIDLNIF
jgi:hypothetical protein